MKAALISTCVLVAATLTAAVDLPSNSIGDGPLSSQPVALNIPAGKGMRYAGPIVYTNEKPPIIFFPNPPKDAKPGFGPGSFGRGKSKSIKYVPMPHHDLPVLIYTSDKMPPIHVVHPPNGEGSSSSSSHSSSFSSSFGPPPPKENFRPLSATYREIISASTSPRIVTSTYEIPSTSYGTPMQAFDSPIEFSSSSSSSNSESTAPQQIQYKPLSTFSFGPPAHTHHVSHGPPRPGPGYRGPPRKSPPHILYSGHPPIHMFDEPNVYEQAPREVPLKTFDEFPPKASFGPAKPAFGSYSVVPPASYYNQRPPLQSFGSPPPYRTISTYVPPRDNLIPSSSSQQFSISSVPNSLNIPKQESTASFEHASPISSSHYGGAQHFGRRPPTYSFAPPKTMLNFGPVSIEYGPPTDVFASFSEPTGSLQSFYGAMNEGSAAVPTVKPSSNDNDGWIPGPPPTDSTEHKDGMIEYSSQPGPPTHGHGPSGPGPIHNSIFRPHAQPHGVPSPHSHQHPHPPPFGGSKLASLIQSFKLKRSKPKFALAPKSMHKPPIIIYYGKKPPVHVYQKPDEEYNTDTVETMISTEYKPETVITTSSSTSPISVVSSTGESSFPGDIIISNNNNENRNNNGIIRATQIENIDLTYASASQNNEVHVAAPPSPHLTIPEAQQTSSSTPEGDVARRPAIIAAKPVDIFPRTDLDSSIYMARNSLNTILVSDMNGSGSRAIKTYIVRSNEQGQGSAPGKSMEQASIITPQEGNRGSIISSTQIAQDRISGEHDLYSSSPSQADQVPENGQVVQEVDIEQRDRGNDEDNALPPTILVVSPEQKEEIIEQQQKQQQEDEQTQQANDVQVQLIQSPSSFQTSLSKAEKEAEEKEKSV